MNWSRALSSPSRRKALRSSSVMMYVTSCSSHLAYFSVSPSFRLCPLAGASRHSAARTITTSGEYRSIILFSQKRRGRPKPAPLAFRNCFRLEFEANAQTGVERPGVCAHIADATGMQEIRAGGARRVADLGVLVDIIHPSRVANVEQISQEFHSSLLLKPPCVIGMEIQRILR